LNLIWRLRDKNGFAVMKMQMRHFEVARIMHNHPELSDTQLAGAVEYDLARWAA
jgi:hypothetical protein